MNVESEILRIQHNIASAYTKVAEKGGEVPSQPNSANLAAAVQTIPQGETYIAGDGIDITETAEGPKIGVTTPVRSIVTQAEYDALPEVQQSKGLYVISDGGDGGDGGASAGEVYSTEETRIGTWIDGKPLYRKVVVTTSPNTTDGTVIPADAEKNYVSIKGYLDAAVQTWRIFFNSVMENDHYVIVYCSSSNNSIHIRTNYVGYQNRGVVLVLEYTKTTDEGGTV